jgi:hypothetical protein
MYPLEATSSIHILRAFLSVIQHPCWRTTFKTSQRTKFIRFQPLDGLCPRFRKLRLKIGLLRKFEGEKWTLPTFIYKRKRSSVLPGTHKNHISSVPFLHVSLTNNAAHNGSHAGGYCLGMVMDKLDAVPNSTVTYNGVLITSSYE